MYKHMGKVLIELLQGSAVTQTMLGGLAIYHPVTLRQVSPLSVSLRSITRYQYKWWEINTQASGRIMEN